MPSCAAIVNRRECRLPTGTQLAKLPHKRTLSHGHSTNPNTIRLIPTGGGQPGLAAS